ncbi:MAG TPA: class I SAM-dependent methyltransferase [Bryobacteraceae bacterium]|nr:class I SAM-dependent methyltransferase [Bryobacteraceae bacterium]
MAQLDAVYASLWTAHGDEFAALDRSLGPRSWTFLLDVAGEAALGPHSTVVDVGCGRGKHCFELARRFGCRAVGIDLVLPPLHTAARNEERPPLVEFAQGDIERLPIRTESIDFVWCRDMLVHVRNLEAAVGECSRVLRSGGRMLAWVTMETELMERREAERLYAPLAIEPKSVSKQDLQAAFQCAGFTISRREELGSELIEFYEERDGRASRELMRIARMRRMRDDLIAEWGRTRYDTAHALYHWVVYHLLGKLSSGFYLLEKAGRWAG